LKKSCSETYYGIFFDSDTFRVFYSLGKDIWSQSEDLWEGIFSIIATIMITIMGLAMLRLNKMKEKWRVKIAQAILDSDKNVKTRFKVRRWAKKYALALLNKSESDTVSHPNSHSK
jgi:FTR1 family protein